MIPQPSNSKEKKRGLGPFGRIFVAGIKGTAFVGLFLIGTAVSVHQRTKVYGAGPR